MYDTISRLARRILPRKMMVAPEDSAPSDSNPDEIALVRGVLKNLRDGQMIDVGAHFGGACSGFLELGWDVLAFEPDDSNRRKLMDRCGHFSRLTVDTRAVCDQISDKRAFYTSPVSTGISSLHNFHASHAKAQLVAVTTLDRALAEYGIRSVDFLKIDIEGYDLFALKGLSPALPVRVIMAEFEDRKTRGLGYSSVELADHLVARGYGLVASMWAPIVEYGQRHRWRKFARYPCAIDPEGWGNMIAFSNRTDLEQFEQLAEARGFATSRE